MSPNPDTWTLRVSLPRDRRQSGDFELLDAAGNKVLVGGCLGKADNEQAIKAGNAARDPIRPYGDTPSGLYRPARVLHLVPRHQRMGDYAIPMIGAAGQALGAMAARTGLYVHAGRGDARLVPTYGCLRLLDRDMLAIQRRVGDSLITVEIAER